MNVQCHFCKKKISVEGRVSRSETCPECGYDIHCCMNCRFYDESKHNKCSDPQAEWVSDRERRNYCDYFEINPASEGVDKGEKENAREKAESLFKK